MTRCCRPSKKAMLSRDCQLEEIWAIFYEWVNTKDQCERDKHSLKEGGEGLCASGNRTGTQTEDSWWFSRSLETWLSFSTSQMSNFPMCSLLLTIWMYIFCGLLLNQTCSEHQIMSPAFESQSWVGVSPTSLFTALPTVAVPFKGGAFPAAKITTSVPRPLWQESPIFLDLLLLSAMSIILLTSKKMTEIIALEKKWKPLTKKEKLQNFYKHFISFLFQDGGRECWELEENVC